jgi:hypothetical protein
MGIRLVAVRTLHGCAPAAPMYRSIVAVDLEGSTKRTNPVKGKLRRILYDLLERALEAAGISEEHLEPLTDRGDGVLVLIRPHDDVPKTVLFGRLMPMLTALLLEHNAAVAHQALSLRLRVVVHAGEVHYDGRGFFGEDLDVAIRLLDSRPVKRALKEAVASPLVLVVSEEIFSGVVRQGYVDGGPYEQRVRVRVGNRLRRGWVNIPVQGSSLWPARIRRREDPGSSPSLVMARADGPGRVAEEAAARH